MIPYRESFPDDSLRESFQNIFDAHRGVIGEIVEKSFRFEKMTPFWGVKLTPLGSHFIKIKMTPVRESSRESSIFKMIPVDTHLTL